MLTAFLAAGLTACTGRTSHTANTPPPERHVASAPKLAAFLGCLRRVGADAIAVSSARDLRVSGGEVAVAFSTFDAYIGFAEGPAEARDAAQRLDEQLTVLGQAGQAAIRGNAVYYYDASLVPAAAGRLVTACAAGAENRALLAMMHLSAGLPRIEFPAELASAFARACRNLGTAEGCACAYRRASRLYRYGQIAELAARPGGLRLAALIRMCAKPPPSRTA